MRSSLLYSVDNPRCGKGVLCQRALMMSGSWGWQVPGSSFSRLLLFLPHHTHQLSLFANTAFSLGVQAGLLAPTGAREPLVCMPHPGNGCVYTCT